MEEHAHQLLETRLKREASLSEFARQALRSSARLDRLLKGAVAHVVHALSVRHVKILQYRPERADLLIVEGTGWREGVVGHVAMSIDLSSPPGRAFQTGEPVCIADLPRSDEFVYSDLLREHDIVTVLNVPIVADGASWGVLEADSTVLHSIPQEDTHFLHVMAYILGEAIQRHRRDLERESERRQAAEMAERRRLLLREMQHRFKNNLTLIQSLLVLRQRGANKDVKRVLAQIADRVTAIGLAQDQLSIDNDLRSVRLGAYVRALCARLEPQREDVTIRVVMEDADVLVEQAVPVGLIINEAVTNSLKHAFNAGGGTITVEISYGVETVLVAISDDGAGVASASNGLGTHLLKALAAQIGGTLNVESSPGSGTRVRVEFPLRR